MELISPLGDLKRHDTHANTNEMILMMPNMVVEDERLTIRKSAKIINHLHMHLARSNR